MAFPGLTPFNTASPATALTGASAPQGGCPTCASGAACPTCASAGGTQLGQSPVFPGMNSGSLTGTPAASSLQGDPMAQAGLQSMTPDTQALFLQITTMVLSAVSLIVGLLAGILSGTISGKAPAGTGPAATSAAAGPDSSGSNSSGSSPDSGTAPSGSTGGVNANPKKTANGTFTLPLGDQKYFKGRSPFGAPRAGHTHAGNDFMAPTGTPVLAAAEGEIIRSVPVDDGNTAGIRIGIRHPNGDETFYYHLSEVGINPATGKPYKEGDKVAIGQQIGKVGDTGNAKGTPHLHFEIHPNGGAAVDPWAYFIKELLPAGF